MLFKNTVFKDVTPNSRVKIFRCFGKLQLEESGSSETPKCMCQLHVTTLLKTDIKSHAFWWW